MNATAPDGPSGGARVLTGATAAAIAAVSAAYALFALDTLILAGTFPFAAAWTDTLPVVACASLGLLLALAALRRPGATCAAGGVVAWALAVSGVCELPSFATNFNLGDTPRLWPWLLALGTLLGGVTVAGPRGFAPRSRLAVLAVFAATSNGKLFSRDDQAIYALLAAAVLLLLLELARTPLAPLGRGARAAVGLGASFVLWVFVAALLGDGVGQGLRVAGRVATGAALALALALTLDRDGRRAVALALLAGVAAALVVLAAGYADAAAVTGWAPLFDSRLRLFDMHPNGVGPLFALGLTLGAGFALAPGLGRPARGACAGLALASVLALVQTDSRASLFGAVAGAGTFALAWARRAPRDGRPWYAAGLGLLALAIAAWCTPAADGARARLDALTQSQSALGQRYHFWRMALDAIERSPWFGVGPNQYHVHAQYARPSFYDGTSQTLHTHNLPLGVAEGAGWPALVLWGALLLVTLEAARRTLRRREGRAERAVPAGILAAFVALLAANLLDLGQSQSTFVPLFGWIVLGWFGSAATREHRRGPASATPVVGLVWIGLALAVVQPLAGAGLRQRALVLHDRGRPEESLSTQLRALAIDPGDTRGLPATARMAARLGWRAMALELRERRVASAPGRASAHLSLARELHAQGRSAAAARSLARARELDPLGEQREDFEILGASLALAAGDRQRAVDALVRTSLWQGAPWERLPMVALPSDAQGSTQRAFAVPPGLEPIPLGDIVDAVAQSALERVDSDPVTARRQLYGAILGYRADGRPERSLEVSREYARRLGAERIPSMVAIEVDALLDAGRADEALALAESSAGADTKALLFRRARAHFALGRLDEAIELAERAHGSRLGNDLFFDAGAYAPEALLRSRLFQRAERWEEAALALRLALRDTRAANDRFGLATDYWQAVVDAAPGAEPVLDALAILGPALGGKLEAPDRSAAMRARAGRGLAASGLAPGEFAARARSRLRGGGLAAEELLDAVEELARARPPAGAGGD